MTTTTTTKQFSTTLRNALLSQYISSIGSTPKLRIMTGAIPANCAASQTGTQLWEAALPATWQNTASGGQSTLAGTWSATVANSGTASYYRFLDSGAATCHEQGLCSQAFSITTSGSTSAGGNVLNFSSTTGVAVGQSISGAGIPTGAAVASLTSTTVTMTVTSTAGVSSSTPIYFGDTSGDLWLANLSLTAGATLTITSRTITAPGA